MAVKVFVYNYRLGHGYTDGSGFGSESITNVNYINFPQGYCYMRNLVFREDGTLRPYYNEATTNLGTVGTGAIRTILSEKNNVLYAIGGDAKLYYSTDSGANWTEITYDGTPPTPTLTTGTYTGAYFSGGTKFVFKSANPTEPAYVISEV